MSENSLLAQIIVKVKGDMGAGPLMEEIALKAYEMGLN